MTAGLSQRAQPFAFQRSRFELSPPRNFLYPAILLLLVEGPRHGYALAAALPSLGFGPVERPNVYRALGMLAADGLVESWAATAQAGPSRRVYGLTPEGEQMLRGWMVVIAEQRERLGHVLRYYAAARGLAA